MKDNVKTGSKVVLGAGGVIGTILAALLTTQPGSNVVNAVELRQNALEGRFYTFEERLERKLDRLEEKIDRLVRRR